MSVQFGGTRPLILVTSSCIIANCSDGIFIPNCAYSGDDSGPWKCGDVCIWDLEEVRIERPHLVQAREREEKREELVSVK